jgi:hypothetical protein
MTGHVEETLYAWKIVHVRPRDDLPGRVGSSLKRSQPESPLLSNQSNLRANLRKPNYRGVVGP